MFSPHASRSHFPVLLNSSLVTEMWMRWKASLSGQCFRNKQVLKPWRRKCQLTPVFIAWRIFWTEKPGGLESIVSQRVSQDLATKPPPTLCLSPPDFPSVPAVSNAPKTACSISPGLRVQTITSVTKQGGPQLTWDGYVACRRNKPGLLKATESILTYLAGYSPRGRKESDMTERLSMHASWVIQNLILAIS